MEQIQIERVDAVAKVTITNPPQGFMNRVTVQELGAAMDSLEADDHVRAIVFTGGLPGVFVRHYDVTEIIAAAHALKSAPADMTEGRETPTNALFNRVEACAKPTIAAINGMCMGGGYEFALACDLRLAQDGDYAIGLPEIRVGIFPGAGGTQRLARTLGPSAALDCILRGRVFTPREAAARGMVHDMILGDVLGEAMRVASRLSERPEGAVRAVKSLVRSAPMTPLPEGISAEWSAFRSLITSDPDVVEIMQAFVDDGAELNRTH